MLERFEDLPPSWDDFLDIQSRKVVLNQAVYDDFKSHFCCNHLPFFFCIQDGEIDFNKCSFEENLNDLGLCNGRSLYSHKKSRTNYLKEFGKFEELEDSRALLKFLLAQWEEYQINQRCEQLPSGKKNFGIGKKQDHQLLTSSPQELAELLAELDLTQQKQAFKDDYLRYRQLVSAFVVQADPALQNWLLWSLFQAVGGILGVTLISTTRKQLSRSFGNFLGTVASYLGLPEDSTDEDILDKLFDCLHQKAIVIVVRLDEQQDQRSPKALNPAFRDDFWLPLVKKLEQPSRSAQPRLGAGLTLLMMRLPQEAGTFSEQWPIHPDCDTLLAHPPNQFAHASVELGPVNLDSDDVRAWLRQANVRQFMEKYRQGQTADSCWQALEGSLSSNSTPIDSYTVLDNICEQFGLDGLKAMEETWQKLLQEGIGNGRDMAEIVAGGGIEHE